MGRSEYPCYFGNLVSGTVGGEAIANTLFGTYNPGGKLSVTFPKTIGQIEFNFPFKPGSHAGQYFSGPNGSGKTSTTVQLLHNEWAENSLYINPDNIAQEQYGDWNSPVAVLKAAELATKMRYECLRKRQDFVFETVFSSDEKLAFVEEQKKQDFLFAFFLSVQIILR